MKTVKDYSLNLFNLALLFCCAAWLFAPVASAQNEATKTQQTQERIKQQMQKKQQANPQPQTNSQPQPIAPQTSIVDAAPTTTTKKSGVYRVGILMPKAQMTQSASAADAAVALQASLVAYLKGPAVDIVPLEARIPAQIEAEIKEKQIDYVLYASLTQKKGGGGFGSLMKVVAPIAMIASPVGMLGGLGGMVAAGAAGAAIQGVAGSIKAKDEITLEYKLAAPGKEAEPRLTSTIKAKAKKDGEDVLSPLIEQAATAIVTDLTKK